MPVVVTDVMLAEIRARVPELPEAKRRRFVEQYGLPEYDAGVLISDAAVAAFFEQAAAKAKNAKAISNWVMTELLGKFEKNRVAPQQLAELVGLIESGQISGKMGKEIFAEMFVTGKAAALIVKEKGLVQVSDSGALESFVDEAIANNPKSVTDFKAGNAAAINFLKGQVMRLSKGKANPQLVSQILERKLRKS
jgi:aspartyl-tRNA(Asn)/glutamyl-tRNA(Gln) amidotransferase subunit B